MIVHQARFRALITLYPDDPHPATLRPHAREYPNPTRALVIRARPLRNVGSIRYIPAEICWDSAQSLHPGDRAWVTVTVTDDDAGAYIDAGQRFTLWSGGDVGDGIIARKVYTRYSPS